MITRYLMWLEINRIMCVIEGDVRIGTPVYIHLAVFRGGTYGSDIDVGTALSRNVRCNRFIHNLTIR